MLFFTAIISVYILFTLILNRKNKVIASICLHFLSIELFLFFSILYIAKVYQYTPLFNIDTNLFFLLLKPSFPVYSLVSIILVSTCITLFADFMLMCSIKKLNNIIKSLYIFLIGIFFVLNLPDIKYTIMLRADTFFYSAIHYITKPFSQLLVIASLTIPIIYIIMYTMRTSISYKKFSFNSTIVSLFVVDIFVLLLFFVLPTKHIVPWHLNDFSLPKADYYTLRNFDSQIWSDLIVIMLVIVCVLTIIFSEKPMRFLIKNTAISKRSNKLMNENSLMLFHSYKNAFWGITKLSEQALKYPNNAVENLNIIKSSAEETYHAICRAMKLMSNFKTNDETVNLKECILQSITLNKHENIEFETKIPYDDIIVNVDKNHLLEVFNNIFQNAIEAIIQKQPDKGKISVDVYYEPGGTEIKITDNGCGIKYSLLKQHFSTFGSTKHNNFNFGLGLNYVKAVMDAYNGNISIRSKYGKFTEITLFLPLILK